jgi:hypothetical protein
MPISLLKLQLLSIRLLLFESSKKMPSSLFTHLLLMRVLLCDE